MAQAAGVFRGGAGGDAAVGEAGGQDWRGEPRSPRCLNVNHHHCAYLDAQQHMLQIESP